MSTEHKETRLTIGFWGGLIMSTTQTNEYAAFFWLAVSSAYLIGSTYLMFKNSKK